MRKFLIVLFVCVCVGCSSSPKTLSDSGSIATDTFVVQEPIPADFHQYEEHYWVYDEVSRAMVDSMELYIEKNGVTGSYNMALLREKISAQRDSLVWLMDSLVSVDDYGGVVKNLYELAYIYSEILDLDGRNNNPAQYMPSKGFNHKINRIEYFVKTAPFYANEDAMRKRVINYALAFKNNLDL